MKVYQVVGNYGNGCSWNSEAVIAIYLNETDADLHALYANEWNEKQEKLRPSERDSFKNPYDPPAYSDVNTSYCVQEAEVLESFEERE